MVRIILGAVAGFFVWSVLWVGSDAVLTALSPGWYGRHLTEFQSAIENQTAGYQADSMLLIIALVRSVIVTLISGFAAAWIAKENAKTTLVLGILLLLFGLFIQSIYWNFVPLWYHIPFLALLIPVTMLGGKLKKF